MKVMQTVRPLVFTDGECEVRVQYGNRGEPFREGVEISFSNDVSFANVLLTELKWLGFVTSSRNSLSRCDDDLSQHCNAPIAVASTITAKEGDLYALSKWT